MSLEVSEASRFALVEVSEASPLCTRETEETGTVRLQKLNASQ